MNPDFSEEFEQNPLPLNLVNDYDYDYDYEKVLSSKKRLEALITGTITPPRSRSRLRQERYPNSPREASLPAPACRSPKPHARRKR